MCGRYTLTVSQQQLAEEFELAGPLDFPPRYNIAPTQRVPIIRADESPGGRRIETYRWGLIPNWAKDPSVGNRMINARAETVTEKPAFRDALRTRRCLVPCSGFYEWKKLDPDAKKSAKQPYYIRRRDEGLLMAFAGLWDRWRSPDGDAIDSFTILTTEPNELMSDLHDRMPVILSRDQYPVWLDARCRDPARLTALLRPCPASELTAYAVSSAVNNPKIDEPICILPAR